MIQVATCYWDAIDFRNTILEIENKLSTRLQKYISDESQKAGSFLEFFAIEKKKSMHIPHLVETPNNQTFRDNPALEGIQNRALSIRQPYVEMILRGIKKIEYRSKPTRIRGRVYLYASQKPGDQKYYAQLHIEPGSLATGFLLGTVEIVDCTKALFGDYQWHLANPERLAEPRKPENRPQPAWFRPFREEK